MKLHHTHVAAPLTLHIHDMDCGCSVCRPASPSADDRLDAVALGQLTALGFLVATLIALIIDPTGMLALLADMIGLHA